jgi:hypothetical protein
LENWGIDGSMGLEWIIGRKARRVWSGFNWLVLDRGWWRALVNTLMNLQVLAPRTWLVRSHKTREDWRLKELVRGKCNNWPSLSYHADFFENEYWVEDGVIGDASVSYVINLGTGDSDSSNHDGSEEHSNSDLAHSLD